ncbi:MAG: AMP-binding protein [Deinococcus-Thermus bacterium]|jgi:phenylacetate-CoA ligase|nr:AMP-binding protein [Deinococcota bacterium]
MVENGGEFYDRQEVREPEQRAAQMFTALPGLIRHAIDNAPGMAAHLEGVDAAAVTTPEALARLPVLHKSELFARQAAEPPFGGLAATPVSRLSRVFVSPGPIAEPESVRTDYWRFARALFAAGFRTGDLIHNTFSYHLTPAGMMVEAGARALGCPVVPAGTGQTARQLEAIARLKPVAYTGTPAFLRTLLEEAAAAGEPATFTRALVSGEALDDELRAEFRARHGVEAFQCYATADLGLVAYESEPRDGLIVDEAVIVEIVQPGTGEPVATGEVGEVLVTSFNPDYPLIRFATGDLSAFVEGASACGRTNRRIRGWLGRADQSVKVRGLFVHPHQVRAVLASHELARGRLVVDQPAGEDRLRLVVEGSAAGGLADALAATLREVTSLRGEVEIVEPGSLGDDGKVIDDRRE